jgi:hypothetical protein
MLRAGGHSYVWCQQTCGRHYLQPGLLLHSATQPECHVQTHLLQEYQSLSPPGSLIWRAAGLFTQLSTFLSGTSASHPLLHTSAAPLLHTTECDLLPETELVSTYCSDVCKEASGCMAYIACWQRHFSGGTDGANSVAIALRTDSGIYQYWFQFTCSNKPSGIFVIL